MLLRKEITELTELTERQKRVEENHKKGYNCAQAVACAYSDLFGVDEKEAFRAVECFYSDIRKRAGFLFCLHKLCLVFLSAYQWLLPAGFLPSGYIR